MKLKKRTSQGIAAVLSLSLLTTGIMIPSSHASAAKIKLNKTKLKLTVGSTYKLKINQKKVKVKWTSSKKKVASVNSKGKVKARKVGTTVISAKVKGKKYKCRVTVQKAKTTKPAATAKTNTTAKAPTARPGTSLATPTPFVIPTPMPPNTSDQPSSSENPIATPGPTATREPIDLDQLAQNITLQPELLTNNILITVTNHNTTWVSDVTINYDFYDTDGNNIATGYTVLNTMQPEEIMYVTVPISDEITAIDEAASELYPDVSEADDNTKYMDLKDSIEFTVEEFTKEDPTLFLDIRNHSKYDADVCYAVFFYDAKHQMVDAFASTMNLNAKNQVIESIDVPLNEEEDTTSTSIDAYQILYTAHGTEEISELAPYVENITLTPEKTQHTLLVAVKNNNTGWLSSLNLEYHLYDAEDNYLFSEEQSLLSLKPGEIQYITINTEPDIIQSIDLEQSYVDITVEPDNGEYKYNTTTRVTAAVAADYEENSFEITITNNSAHDTEGSYVIYFYDAAKKLIGAQQYTYTLMSMDSEIIEVSGPESYDENNSPVYAASCEIKIHASHTL
ncbi:MAG: Ig-like domain-containing protein [Lachnospiraceae bacterium]|nr:Ig-like domain-containing protein [Lachnospiraceae bacterium]